MSQNNCECTLNCATKSVIASIIIGIVAGFLRFTATITVTPAFLWVLFGIGIGFLGIELLSSSLFCVERGCCRILDIFLIGIFGTVLTALILLGITFAATSIIGAIITGFLLFFFTLSVTTSGCLIRCRNNCR